MTGPASPCIYSWPSPPASGHVGSAQPEAGQRWGVRGSPGLMSSGSRGWPSALVTRPIGLMAQTRGCWVCPQGPRGEHACLRSQAQCPLAHTASPWSALLSLGPWRVSVSSPGSPGPEVPACSSQAVEPPECWAGLPAWLSVQDSGNSGTRAAAMAQAPTSRPASSVVRSQHVTQCSASQTSAGPVDGGMGGWTDRQTDRSMGIRVGGHMGRQNGRTYWVDNA